MKWFKKCWTIWINDYIVRMKQWNSLSLTIVVSGGKKYTRYLAQTCWCVWTFSLPFLNYNYIQGKECKRSFKKLSLWNLCLKHYLYCCLGLGASLWLVIFCFENQGSTARDKSLCSKRDKCCRLSLLSKIHGYFKFLPSSKVS